MSILRSNKADVVIIALLCLLFVRGALADCAVSEQARKLDPVEAGFCESDAVFVAEVTQIIETMGGYTEQGSDRTQHFATQRATVRVIDRFKGTPPDRVTMLSQLYDKERAYVFESQKKYLIFAKRLAREDEYAGANNKCSVQPTLHIEEAKNALKRLQQHRKGAQKIDCAGMVLNKE